VAVVVDLDGAAAVGQPEIQLMTCYVAFDCDDNSPVGN
jgi:hypothetical protein